MFPECWSANEEMKNIQGRCLLELATHWRSRKACKGSVARNVIGSLSQFCNSLFLLFCLGWLLVFDYTNFHETSTTAEWDVEACCRLLCCSSEQAVTHQTSFILCFKQPEPRWYIISISTHQLATLESPADCLKPPCHLQNCNGHM